MSVFLYKFVLYRAFGSLSEMNSSVTHGKEYLDGLLRKLKKEVRDNKKENRKEMYTTTESVYCLRAVFIFNMIF